MAVVGQTAQGGKSWAKVRLTRGQSAGGVWEIDQQYPQARLAIGSDASAGWAVQGPGVRPMHFELYWDGRYLFVADTQRVGGVTLNGMPLGPDWQQVRGRGEVVFGQAAMAIETSDGQAIALPDPASARRIQAGEGPSGQHSLPDLTSEATRVGDSPFDGPPSLTGEATRIQDSPLDAAPPPKLGAPPPPPQRPRLGGNEMGQPPAQQAKTLMQDELAGAVAEATRMVAMPDGQPSIVVAPGMGAPPSQPMMQPPMGAPGQPFGAPTAPAKPGGFAPPPGFGEAPPPADKPTMKLPFGLTPRTAAMVGALLLAIVVLAFLGLGDEEEYDEEYVADGTGQVAPPTAVPPTTLAVPPPTTVAIPPMPTGTSGIAPLPSTTGLPPTTGAIAPIPPTAVYVPPTTLAAPPPTVAPPPTSVAPGTPLPPTPERLAADQVLAGRYAEALPMYRALMAQHPERPEYRAMVGILEQRIRAAQCVNGIGPDGRPCAR